MPTDLTMLALDQKRWSITADRLKKSIGRARWSVLILAVSAAALETLGAQIHRGDRNAAALVGYIGAAELVVVAVIRQWRLGQDRLQGWILARAASESFKREMYLYRTSSGAYSGNDAPVILYQRRDQILGKVTFAQKFVVEPNKSDVIVPGPLDVDGYVNQRVNGQAQWFRKKASNCSSVQSALEGAEFVLAIAGALLGAALTMTSKQAYGAWVAVVTTVTGALAAHAAAQKYEQLVVSYRTTADRLLGILGHWTSMEGTLGQLVEQCETLLLAENQGWIAGADDLTKQRGQEGMSGGAMPKPENK